MPSLKAAVLALALAPAQAAKTAEEMDAMTASPSRDLRAQGMKKDLYPHGSRELVDPKWVTDKPMTRKLRGSA